MRPLAPNEHNEEWEKKSKGGRMRAQRITSASASKQAKMLVENLVYGINECKRACERERQRSRLRQHRRWRLSSGCENARSLIVRESDGGGNERRRVRALVRIARARVFSIVVRFDAVQRLVVVIVASSLTLSSSSSS